MDGHLKFNPKKMPKQVNIWWKKNEMDNLPECISQGHPFALPPGCRKILSYCSNHTASGPHRAASGGGGHACFRRCEWGIPEFEENWFIPIWNTYTYTSHGIISVLRFHQFDLSDNLPFVIILSNPDYITLGLCNGPFHWFGLLRLSIKKPMQEMNERFTVQGLDSPKFCWKAHCIFRPDANYCSGYTTARNPCGFCATFNPRMNELIYWNHMILRRIEALQSKRGFTFLRQFLSWLWLFNSQQTGTVAKPYTDISFGNLNNGLPHWYEFNSIRFSIKTRRGYWQQFHWAGH